MVHVIMNSKCAIDHDGPGDPVPRCFCQTCNPKLRRRRKPAPPKPSNSGLSLSPPVAIQKAISADFAEPEEEMGKVGPKEALLRQQREAIATSAKKLPNKEPKPIAPIIKHVNATAPAAAEQQESAVSIAKKTKTTTAKKTVAKSSARKTVKSIAARTTKARKTYDWAGAAEKAATGVIPPAPDFSAHTHRFYRAPLAEAVKLVKDGDLKALQALKFTRDDGSPGMIKRYRDIAVIALKAKK